MVGDEDPKSEALEEEIDGQDDEDSAERPLDDPEGDEDASDGDSDDVDADHGEEELAGEDEGQADGRSQTVSRGQRDYGTLRKRAREAEQERDRLRQELEATRRPVQGKTPAELRAEQEAEAARVALLPVEDQVHYWRTKDRQETDAKLAGIQFQIADGNDAAAFSALCASNPAYAAVREEVEKRLPELRRNGGTTTREILAKFIIGDRAINRAARAKGKQTRAAEARVERQTTKPSNARGDVGGGGGKDERAKRLARLENVKF